MPSNQRIKEKFRISSDLWNSVDLVILLIPAKNRRWFSNHPTENSLPILKHMFDKLSISMYVFIPSLFVFLGNLFGIMQPLAIARYLLEMKIHELNPCSGLW